MSERMVDGRRERGEASRRAILAAASSVIVDAGVGGLTYRAVAERAGVPLARVSYHFPTVDDLLVAATAHYMDDFDRRLADMGAVTIAQGRDLLEACTSFLEELVGPGAAEFLAVVEIRLALHRRGRVVDDRHVIGVLCSFGLDEDAAGSVLSSLFGFAVLVATTDATVTRDQIRTHVRAVLDGIDIPTAPREVAT
ncbi:TetR/AcrR family transcriptional regulator [Dermatobacter hominis]|uniref:TetR/AcrR family transcriptional regulator n=1 Tax=Dermatobacter hominis TaxID=2884263 RepID=UPI001D116958|nr:TetR family transcriptional regulator [Dermatobacter hominis]UDY35021.1 TetR family transcriptional regulator [Dermatobacter hominis]